MYDGTVAGGGGLFPPLVDHGIAQKPAGVVDGSVATATKPLNGGGTVPPESVSSRYQLLLHQLTVVVGVALPAVRSPSAKTPLLGNANTIAVVLALDFW